MTSVIKRPRKAKVAGFIRAQKLVHEKNFDVRRAVKEAGISQTTYYKYLEMFGDTISDSQIEVLSKTVPEVKKVAEPKPSTGSDLERILAENAALQEQIKLRKELAGYAH